MQPSPLNITAINGQTPASPSDLPQPLSPRKKGAAQSSSVLLLLDAGHVTALSESRSILHPCALLMPTALSPAVTLDTTDDDDGDYGGNVRSLGSQRSVKFGHMDEEDADVLEVCHEMIVLRSPAPAPLSRRCCDQ